VTSGKRVQALIIQNANAYKEGLGAKWAGIAQYWADPKTHPEVFHARQGAWTYGAAINCAELSADEVIE
jgi:hypothetical protein